MTRLILGLVLIGGMAACNEAGTPTSPSTSKQGLTAQASGESGGTARKMNATVAVLDGTSFSNGNYRVTQNTAIPPSPWYWQRIPEFHTGDPCTLKWSTLKTRFINTDNNGLDYYLCQL